MQQAINVLIGPSFLIPYLIGCMYGSFSKKIS